MPRNTLSDLNNHLFEQLERLNNDELDESELKHEVSRSKAISEVSKNIIENSRVVLEASKFRDERHNLDEDGTKLLK